MRTSLHAGGGIGGRKAGAERKSAADTLGDSHDIGSDARPFMGKQLARASDTRLDLVEDEEEAVLIAETAPAPA